MMNNNKDIYTINDAVKELNITKNRITIIIKKLKEEGYDFKKVDGKYTFDQNDLLMIKNIDLLHDVLTNEYASSKQLRALYIASDRKIDTRGLKINKQIANSLIRRSMSGENIYIELENLVRKQMEAQDKYKDNEFSNKESEAPLKMEFTESEIRNILEKHNKSIEEEVKILNNKFENKLESIIKLIELDFKIKKDETPFFKYVFILFHKIKGTETGMAIIVEKLDEKNIDILKRNFGNTIIHVYPGLNPDPIIKIKLEEETKLIIHDTDDIFRYNLQKYKIEETYAPLYSIKKN